MGEILHIQCDTCGTSTFADCTCPPGYDPAALGHVSAEMAAMASQAAGNVVAACPFSDLDVLVVCPPGGPCCQIDHHHGQAANACPGGHGACPTPDNCKTWRGMTGPATDAGPCPGGHCHKDLEDCTGCRPLTITVVPGSTQVQIVPGLGV